MVDALACLAMAVYFEARSESFEGQLAVANVVLERVNSRFYPNNVCDVVTQGPTNSNGVPRRDRCQFSFYCDGKEEVYYNPEAYKHAEYIAELAMKGVVYGPTIGATHYHTVGVNPDWAKDFGYSYQVGTHIFYVDIK
jgi:spore germination cell wall hydrolase CwlJ-like protein